MPKTEESSLIQASMDESVAVNNEKKMQDVESHMLQTCQTYNKMKNSWMQTGKIVVRNSRQS